MFQRPHNVLLMEQRHVSTRIYPVTGNKISVVVHDELDEDENKGSMKDILIYP